MRLMNTTIHLSWVRERDQSRCFASAFHPRRLGTADFLGIGGEGIEPARPFGTQDFKSTEERDHN
jgi:hypothetical protein